MLYTLLRRKFVPIVVPFNATSSSGARLDEIVGLVFHEHLIFDFVRMDREFLLVLSDAEHSLWVLGSSALVPDLKRLLLLLE